MSSYLCINTLGFGFSPSRLSDPRLNLAEPDRFGVIYFGSSLKVCFLERVLRDRRNGRLGDVPIPYTELEQLTCAEITTVRPLNLVDLRGDCPVKMGVPTDAVRALSHRLGQQWSLAFWLHKEHPDGILYPSRLNEEINLALYDVALPKMRVVLLGRPGFRNCFQPLGSPRYLGNAARRDQW
jgi:RES domain-containing protein